MDLYNKTGERLFSPLTSKNKRIYVKALLLLFESFKTEWRINKETLASILSNDLSTEFEYYQFEEEEDNTYSGFSRLIIRKLEETKWID